MKITSLEIFMNRPMTAVVFTALVCFGTQTAAADSMSQPTMTKHQMMKECMAKRKASDSGMSKEDMKKACRDLSKTQKDNADRNAG
jgi:pentapeptide MXKDX repeat protein